MKKGLRFALLGMVLALAIGASACEVSQTTLDLRAEYQAKLSTLVDMSDYNAETQEDINALIAEYSKKIGSMAAQKRMEAAVLEFQAALGEFDTISDLVDAYVAGVSARVDQTIDALQLVGTGIGAIDYDENNKHAVFKISDSTAMIRELGDNSAIISLFQQYFQDVSKAVITYNNGCEEVVTFTAEELAATNLKHLIGAKFIQPMVGDDYATAPLSELLGYKCTAVITLKSGELSGEATFSCEFVAIA